MVNNSNNINRMKWHNAQSFIKWCSFKFGHGFTSFIDQTTLNTISPGTLLKLLSLMFITILFISYYENIELTLYFLIISIHTLLWVFCYINVREYRRAIKMDKNGYILVLLLFVMIFMFNLIKGWSFTCRPCIVTVLIFSSATTGR